MIAMAWAEPIWNQEPNSEAGSQGFGPSCPAFPGYKQEAGWEGEQLECGTAGTVLIWDPGAYKMRI